MFRSPMSIAAHALHDMRTDASCKRSAHKQKPPRGECCSPWHHVIACMRAQLYIYFPWLFLLNPCCRLIRSQAELFTCSCDNPCKLSLQNHLADFRANLLLSDRQPGPQLEHSACENGQRQLGRRRRGGIAATATEARQQQQRSHAVGRARAFTCSTAFYQCAHHYHHCYNHHRSFSTPPLPLPTKQSPSSNLCL